MKKTIKIQDLKEYVNSELKRIDKFADDSYKAALSNLITKVLIDSKNYQGFQYLYWDEIGCIDWNKAGCPEDEYKDVYIYGNKRSKYKGSEYARVYY